MDEITEYVSNMELFVLCPRLVVKAKCPSFLVSYSKYVGSIDGVS